MNAKLLRKKIKRHSRYRKLKELLEDPDVEQYNIPFSEYLNEIKLTYRSRRFRNLDPNELATILEDVTSCSIEDTQLRSRYTEMLIVSTQAIKSIAGLLDRFESWVFIEFSGDLRDCFTNQADRKKLIDDILKDFRDYLKDAEAFKEQVSLILSDLDKAGYSVKNIVDAQKLIFRPEMAGTR